MLKAQNICDYYVVYYAVVVIKFIYYHVFKNYGGNMNYDCPRNRFSE